MKLLLTGLAGVIFAAASAATAATFNDRATFLAQGGSYIDHTDLTTDFSITAESGSSINTDYATYTDMFAPNPYVVVNGVENFNAAVTFTNAVYAFGMDVYEPHASTGAFNGCNATCIESTFEISFLASGSLLAAVTFEPENDILDFFGYRSAIAFDRVEIREIVGGIDNEMFGNFVTSTTPIPLPAGLPLLLVGLGAFAVLRGRGRD